MIFLLLVAAVTGLAAAPASARAAQQTGLPLSAATPGVTLPLIIVDTRQRIPDEPKVRGSLRIVDNGRGRRNHVHDEPVFRDRMGIEVRGYSSQQLFPKKQYALELRRGAPRTRFVELVLNGDYRGVYVLTQRIELGKGRVELDEDGRSGGYILELTSPNQSRGEQLFVLPITRRPILYTDPNRDELSARQAGWIRGYVGRFERALYRGGDWRRYLDVAAAVDYVLLQELFKNEDGFYSSTYMHKGRGAKLAIGPVWDFDVAMGNSIHGRSRHLDGLMLSDRTWTERLYRKTAFTDLMVRRWRELRRSGLRRELMHAVGAMSAQLRSPAARNFRRWPILGRYVPPNPRDPRTGRYRATWQAEVRFSRNWLSRRIAWLDRGLARLAR